MDRAVRLRLSALVIRGAGLLSGLAMGEQAEREKEIAGGVGVTVERRGAVAIWTIDRPARMNALSRAVVRELGRLAREAKNDPALRAVVITGAGEKAFCAGADLKERRSMDMEDIRDFLPLYRSSFGSIDALGVPTEKMIPAMIGKNSNTPCIAVILKNFETKKLRLLLLVVSSN